MSVVKTVLVFVLAFVIAAYAWSLLLFFGSGALGANINEAANVETTLAPWLALATAFVATRTWRKR